MKKGYNSPNLIFYDIETFVINGRMKFRLGVVTCENFSFLCYDVDTFTDKLIELTEKRRTNYLIAHNAQFDFSLLNHDYFNSFELKTFSTNPLIVHYVYKDFHRHNTNIIFIDSMSFFKNSLDELGKIFGQEKLTVDVLRDIFDSEIGEYCKQDTLVVAEVMSFINEQCIKYDIPFPVTFAQMAFLIYKKNFLSLTIQCPDRNDIMMLEREGYFGGRVEVFDFNKFNAKVFDINSLYPYVMRNNYFPISVVGYYNRENCYNNQLTIMSMLHDKIDNGASVMAKVVVEIDKCFIGPIPKRINDKLCFPTGTFETVLCTPELKLIKENIIEVKEILLYAREKIFANYVDTFYNERQQYDDKHPNNLFYKLLLNSLYGKFGQRRFEFKRFEQFDDILRYGSTDLDTGDEELIRIDFFNGKAYRKDVFYDNPHSFVAVAAFVTSYARCELYTNLINNLDRLIYCDTDSMILNGTPQDIDIGDNLGEWKLEKDYEDFEAMGNKHYRAKGLLKIKGVPKDAEVLSDYSFRFERITKMKESIVRYKEPTPYVITMTKNYSKDYDKRIMNEDKTTQPLFVAEYQSKLISPT